MAAELIKPGVEVLQVARSQTPTFLRPTLVPCVVGPAFEVLNVLTADGTLNSKAKYGAYAQVGKTITQSSFPDPRSNIDELDVQEATIRPFLVVGGKLSELLMGPGEAFLGTSTGASKAAMKSKIFSGATGLALVGTQLCVAIDQPVRLNKTKDVTVTFEAVVGGSATNLTAQQACDQINAAVGKTVATVSGDAPNDRVMLASPSYGAKSSVTVRQGYSANSVLELGYSGASAAHEERVEGSGFRAQDDNDNDTLSPWIEFYRGAYLLDGVDTTFVATRTGLVNVKTGSYASAKATAVTFGDSGTMPIKVGDQMYADGAKVKSGEIAKVELTRFKVGTINTALSTADENGRYTSKVYDVQEVGTVADASAFAPTWAWFKACGLKGTETPVAATLTGTVKGVAATPGSVLSADLSSGGPFALAGLTLDLVVEEDGVETEVTYTFSGGPFADAAAVAAAIGTDIDGITASDSGGKLKLATSASGRLQAVTVKTTGTANDTLGFSDTADTAGRGTDVEFPAILDTAANTFATTTLTGKVLALEWTTDGTTWTEVTYTFAGEMASAAAAVAALAADATFSAEFGAVDLGSTKIRLYSKRQDAWFRVSANNTCEGVGNLSGFPADTTESSRPLAGATLQFALNDNPHVYEASFGTNSLDEAVDQINLVAGATVAAIAGAADDTLELTSTLAGLGSKVLVTAGNAATALGLSTSEQVGSGRPLPDAYLDDTNNLVIGSEIVRNLVTGFPLDQSQSPGTLYVQYKALRRDVTAVAQNAGVLRISDQDTLAEVLNPLTEDNPLGLGVFLAMVNAPNFEVKCLGVDAVSGAAPTGTQAAWARAAGFLESEEIYAIAPLTQDEVVHGIWAAHASVMSEGEQGGERIVFVNKAMPTRKNSTVAASGTQANSTSTANQLQLDSSPAAGLVEAGLNPALPFDVDDGVYIEFEVDGELKRYNLASVSGALANFNTTFADDENTDGFYSTADFEESLVNAAWSLKVRGASLDVPGSNPSRLDYSLVAETVAGMNESVLNRRVYSVFPDQVKSVVDGVEKTLPGYYACAAIAGMVAAQPPQQGFTNFPIAGITGVVGPEKFSRKQLNVMAGGGTYILWQETPNAAVTCRHQVSTDLSSIEHRELSITKSVDFVAKFLRASVRRYIGTLNVNDQFLDTIGTTINGLLQFLVESGVLNGANLNNVLQDKDNPDTVIVDVTLEVAYPANYIKITLVV